jgi:hypothetical protein
MPSEFNAVKLEPWQGLMERGLGAELTQSQFKELGYSLLDESERIEGIFFALHLYSVRGLTAPSEAIVSSHMQDEGGVGFGIGPDYSELASRITGLGLGEDKEQWNEVKRNRQPFLMLQIGPSKRYSALCGHYKRLEGQIIYEPKMFECAHREVKTKEEKLTSKALSAISCCISPTQDLYIDHLRTYHFGKTESGEVLVQCPQAYAIYESDIGMGSEQLQRALDKAISHTASISSRSGYLLGLGITERDVVKRFLFFFLAIETEIDRVFKSMPPSAFAKAFRSALDAPASDLVHEVVKGRNNNDLRIKFLWCMMTVLPHLSCEDLSAFKELKKIRDGIAHGSFQSLPEQGDAEKAYRLATRILLQGHQ